MSQRISTAACAEACLFSSCGGGIFGGPLSLNWVLLCCVVGEGPLQSERERWLLKNWRGGSGLCD